MVYKYHLWLLNFEARPPEFLAGFLLQFHHGRCHFYAGASIVVYVQFHNEVTTNVLLISVCHQWQEVTNGNSGD